MIMSIWALAPKSLAENCIPKEISWYVSEQWPGSALLNVYFQSFKVSISRFPYREVLVNGRWGFQGKRLLI